MDAEVLENTVLPDEQPIEEVKPEAITGEPEQSAGDEPPHEEEKKPSKVQKRIDELTREKYQQQREAESWRQETLRVLAEKEAIEKEARSLKLQAQKPTLDQVGHDPEVYAQVLDQFYQQQAQQARQEQELAAERARAVQNAQRNQVELAVKVQEASTKYADFETVLANPALPQLGSVNPPLYAALLSSEKFADVAYYLANNAAEAHRLASMQPVQAVRELGRLEAKFDQPPKTVSSAPAPVTTVGGNEQGAKDPSAMSYEEYRKWRRSGK